MKNENKGVSEVDKFFDTLPSEDKKEADVFDDKAKSIESDTSKESDTDEDEPRKNRRQRRLEEKLQQERESNIILAERLRAKTELEETVKANPQVDERLLRIFGTSPEAQELSKHFADLLAETRETAKQEALKEISSLEQQESVEVAKNEDYIDQQLEAIEDNYHVDITSNSPQAVKNRKGFLELLERVSPKDEDGTITDYADFQSTYELYAETHREKIDNSRNKEIADRSMQRSGSSEMKSNITPGFRGWERDYGL